MNKLPLIFLILSNISFAKLNYELEITESLSNPQIAIAKIKGIKPSVGEQVILPFTKTEYCIAEIKKIDGIFLLLSTDNCTKESVKPGQRGLIKGRRITNRAKTNFSDFEIGELSLDSIEVLSEKNPILVKKKDTSIIKTKKLSVIDTDLGSSTIKTSFNHEVSIGDIYRVESVFGEECLLKVLVADSAGVILDSSDCSFEREIDRGELLTPSNQ